MNDDQTRSQNSQNLSDVATKHAELTKIYPFIDEIVDTLYTEHLNTLMDKSIETESDKSVFLMFVMMYFCIHLKLKHPDDDTKDNTDDHVKREQIKVILSEVIRDSDKRRLCINMFQSKFQDLFISNGTGSKRLLKNK